MKIYLSTSHHDEGGFGLRVSMDSDILNFVSNKSAENFLDTTSITAPASIQVSHGLNITSSSADPQQVAWKRYLTLLLLVMSLAGLTGNIMVIIAICLVKKLKSNTNIILSSLATADMLVCVLVMPPALIQLVTGGWPLGDFACSLYIFLDVCLCTSSILHMCAISLDRYIGIAYPLHFSRFRTKKTTAIKLLLVWLLAILIACPVFIHASMDNKSIYISNVCGMNNLAFQVYGSLCAFYIPLIVMTVTYFLTIRKLNLQSNIEPSQRLRRAHGIKRRSTMSSHQYTSEKEDTISSNITDNSMRTSTNSYSSHSRDSSMSMSQVSPGPWDRLLDQSNTDNLTGLDERRKWVGQRLGNDCYKSLVRDMKLPIPETEEEPNSQTSLLEESEEQRCTYNTSRPDQNGNTQIDPQERSTNNSYTRAHINGYNPNISTLQGRMTRGSIAKLMSKWRSTRSFNGKVDREKKATQVLGIVFLAFVVSWSPFFIINILTAICNETCIVSAPVMDFVLWLGYSASIANPIIYTIINKHFQRAFKDMLTCKIWKRRSRSTPSIRTCITTINGQMVVMTTSLGGKVVFHRNNKPLSHNGF